ncbi:MAG: FtsH protease activity modulator HflK [Rickettsiaceae bacterium]|nr:FtsH protease activity modulator HflK [Rickettsiaceae bacterium]
MINKNPNIITMPKSPWEDDERSDEFPAMRKSSRSNFPNFKIPDVGGVPPWLALGAVGVIFLIWLASGLYKISEGEESVVLRFGKYVRTEKPGLNYHLPWPFEEVIVEPISKSRRVEIGYRSSVYSPDKQKFIAHESKMLTGDENILSLHCDVLWHIRNLQDYVFNVLSPEDTVKAAAESAIREVIGETPIAYALSSQKQEIASKIETLVQKTLDSYDIGIDIEMVQLLKAEPPQEVISAYRDVQTSRADKEKEINQALAYNNDVLPKSRGEASKLVQLAEGYKQEVISKAQGDTKRFLAIYSEYVKNKRLIKDRLALETIEEVLASSTKYISGPNTLPHLAIDQK